MPEPSDKGSPRERAPLHSGGGKACLLADIASLPLKPPRSKLEPHRELIRELRRKGRTYRDIAAFFAQRVGLNVAPSTLHSFVKVRARHRKQAQFELPPPASMQSASTSAAIDALKARPASPARNRPRFIFHDNEPLTLKQSERRHG